MYLTKIELKNQAGVNISLDLRSQNGSIHQWISIIGASGAGKTTILKEIFEHHSADTTMLIYDSHRKGSVKQDCKSPHPLYDNDASSPSLATIAKQVLIGTGVLPKDALDIDIIDQEPQILLNRGQSTKWHSTLNLPSSYRSVIEWVINLITHLIHKNPIVSSEDLKAVVLIDDVDLHLDPQWQVRLPTTLKKALPNIQFITTAKSGALVSALSSDEVTKIGYNRKSECIERMIPKENGDGWTHQPKPKHKTLDSGDPRTMTATEIYQSYFDINRLTLNEHGELLRTYSALDSMPNRNAYQDEKLRALEEQIQKLSE